MLNDHFSRPDHISVVDIRLERGVLYFNESCRRDAATINGSCSSLVALDVKSRKVLWQSAPATSNSVFSLHKRFILAGFGLPGKAGHLSLIDKQTGRTLDRSVTRTPTFTGRVAHRITHLGGDRIRADPCLSERHFIYQILDADSAHPRLFQVSVSPAPKAGK